MTATPNRAQELAAWLRTGRIGFENIAEYEGEIIAALDRLASFESAVLPETIEEVEKRHADRVACIQRLTEQRDYAKVSCVDSQLHRDIATLLDALRAVTAERDEARSQLANMGDVRAQYENYAKCAAGEIATLKAKLEAADSRDNRWIRERNEARAALSQSIDERERLLADQEAAADEAIREAQGLRDIAVRSLEKRTAELAAAEERLAACEMWRPIETAPKDETFILAAYRFESELWILRWDVEFEQWMNSDANPFETPDLWMPLPMPPKKGPTP